MVDCGFSTRETVRRLRSMDLEPADLQAVLVTHEHTDHASGVVRFASKHQLPVYATHGTACSDYLAGAKDLREIHADVGFEIGELEIMPVPVPHDAREPVQYVFGHAGRRLGVLTDTGCITRHIEQQYADCDALMLECNHDLRMLAEGPYSPRLKRRVGGDYGHLNNTQAASLLESVDQDRLQHLVVTHISEQNNLPELARKALESVLRVTGDLIRIAHQERGLAWCEIA